MAAQPRPEPPVANNQPANLDQREAADLDQPEAAGPADPQQAAEHAAAVADLEDRWRRALADLDNLRKRYARELERERAAERARVAAQWLPVVDDLDRALAHAAEDPSAVLEGVRAVRDHATAVLARLGYPRYEEVGVPFDPARHEAVQAVADADAPPGTVVAVLRPGYGREDHWLRPAAVAVATARQE
jgi:molecular chaperone GrpE